METPLTKPAAHAPPSPHGRKRKRDDRDLSPEGALPPPPIRGGLDAAIQPSIRRYVVRAGLQQCWRRRVSQSRAPAGGELPYAPSGAMFRIVPGPAPSPAEADWAAEPTPICGIGVDAMACVLSFLDPVEVHSVVAAPLSKMWRSTYASPQDLWKVLCLSDPFRAKIPSDEDADEDGVSRRAAARDPDPERRLGRYRMLYASFVRCAGYLARIRDDAARGARSPSSIDDASAGNDEGSLCPFEGNETLRGFLSWARHVVREKRGSATALTGYEADDDGDDEDENDKERAARPQVGGVMENDTSILTPSNTKRMKHGKCEFALKRSKYGQSEVTHRLLGLSSSALTSRPNHNLDAPWSCAVYSVVNWMAYFSDVEGMQIKCLEVLPYLLKNSDRRAAARRTGLADALLRAMLLFPDSPKLHSSAFHAFVHLARPDDGAEGVLRSHESESEEESVTLFDAASPLGRCGVAVLVDSMRRFAHDPNLQAMGCWSMVNVALVPEQKSALVRAGAVAIAADAMARHPTNIEVQFRALFALINLVILQQPPDSEGVACATFPSERDLLDESVGTIAGLVVRAMRTFHTSEIVLNRACLVLHNLSLDGGYHETLLRTPYLYGMVEWCLSKYRHDPVLRQSTGGTLQRLQSTLAQDRTLHARFLEILKEQRRRHRECL